MIPPILIEIASIAIGNRLFDVSRPFIHGGWLVGTNGPMLARSPVGSFAELELRRFCPGKRRLPIHIFDDEYDWMWTSRRRPIAIPSGIAPMECPKILIGEETISTRYADLLLRHGVKHLRPGNKFNDPLIFEGDGFDGLLMPFTTGDPVVKPRKTRAIRT